MAEEESGQEGEAPPKKKRLVPLLIGLVLALAGGGGGFFAASSGMLGGGSDAKQELPVDAPKVAFLPIPPLVVSVGRETYNRHLRFTAQLEVVPGRERDVEALMPRVTDVLNGYLRAVSLADIEDPAALVRIRAQMLRRVQIIVGEGIVNDLLVMEFVLS